MKTYKIFTLKLAHFLTQRGFRIVGTLPNKDKPYLNVYEFEYSPELIEAMREYKKPE